MGVYDYYKGTCPKCGKKFGYDENGGECGDIQTKDFVYMREGEVYTARNFENCFRTFTVGMENGCFPMNACIPLNDSCPHCKTCLVAVFKDGVLVSYDIA